MSDDPQVEALFARYVEHHVVHGARLRPEELCVESPQLIQPLRELIRHYEQVSEALSLSAPAIRSEGRKSAEALPGFQGFRTIERLGSGGGGEVFKLEDLELGRLVAAKVLRPDGPLRADLERFLQEARALALFEDPRIVRIFEFRRHADPPVLLMEYVDGFELGRIGRSLEFAQRARIVRNIAEAVHQAHALGIQHRDLKPANVLLDAQLRPKILDFGLCGDDPARGHGVGTPAYMAPEQLDPARPIDARADVYALGVMLYELLCGALPYRGESQHELLAAIGAGAPQLPAEIEPTVPEPLQAIALKAMEREPAERYASAQDMAQELGRYLEGRPVLARPTLYQSALARRIRPHLEQVREWLRLKLIYPHEAQRLERAYSNLEAREDDWIIESRRLSFAQIALYLGAFLIFCGSLLYFIAYQSEAVKGLAMPLLVLATPFALLNAVAGLLYWREQKAAAVALYLGAVVLLPLFALIGFQEAGLWPVDPQNPRELFGEGFASNRQLQAAGLLGAIWSYWLALSTRTVGLSACFTFLVLVFSAAALADFDLRGWLEQDRYDVLAAHLLPVLAVVAMLGRFAEVRLRPWLCRPLYLAAAGLFVAIIELVALDGRAMHYLGVSMTPFQAPDVADPVLLDTVTAMTVNGLLIYFAGWLLDSYGTSLMKTSASLLFIISPFAILEPLAYLNSEGGFSPRFDWLYLGLALTMTLLSRFRQRKSFYYAGLINTGVALWLITDRYGWFDRPAWAVGVGAVGLAALAAGALMSMIERQRRRSA